MLTAKRQPVGLRQPQVGRPNDLESAVAAVEAHGQLTVSPQRDDVRQSVAVEGRELEVERPVDRGQGLFGLGREGQQQRLFERLETRMIAGPRADRLRLAGSGLPQTLAQGLDQGHDADLKTEPKHLAGRGRPRLATKGPTAAFVRRR